jgi:hypothetical protein
MKTKLTLLLAIPSLFITSCASTTSSPIASTASTGIKPYPKNTCIVSGNTLGSMGDVITEVYNGQEIKFCCKPCTKKFAANPAKYLSGL